MLTLARDPQVYPTQDQRLGDKKVTGSGSEVGKYTGVTVQRMELVVGTVG